MSFRHFTKILKKIRKFWSFVWIAIRWPFWSKLEKTAFHYRVYIVLSTNWDVWIWVHFTALRPTNDFTVHLRTFLIEFCDSERLPIELQLKCVDFDLKSIVGDAVFPSFDQNDHRIAIHSKLQKFPIFFKFFVKWRKDI